MNKKYQKKMAEQGFIRFQIEQELPEISAVELSLLKETFKTMPVDDYATTPGRFRYFSRAVIMPWNNHLEWLPSIIDESGREVAEYFQGSFNPDYADAYRSFPAIPQAVRETDLLQQIIQYDFLQTYWDKREQMMPINVGVHFVRLQVGAQNTEAVSSPNCMHRDGEPFTFAHLIDRTGITGGENMIAGIHDANLMPKEIPASHIHAEFQLNHTLESYGVSDELVSHYVSAVHLADGATNGHRDMLLIDYQPTVVKPL